MGVLKGLKGLKGQYYEGKHHIAYWSTKFVGVIRFSDELNSVRKVFRRVSSLRSARTEVVEESSSRETSPAKAIRIPRFFVAIGVISRGTVRGCWIVIRTFILYLVRHPIHAAVNVFMAGVLVVAVLTGSNIHKQMILSKISDLTIDKIIEVSAYTRNYRSEESREF